MSAPLVNQILEIIFNIAFWPSILIGLQHLYTWAMDKTEKSWARYICNNVTLDGNKMNGGLLTIILMLIPFVFITLGAIIVSTLVILSNLHTFYQLIYSTVLGAIVMLPILKLVRTYLIKTNNTKDRSDGESW